MRFQLGHFQLEDSNSENHFVRSLLFSCYTSHAATLPMLRTRPSANELLYSPLVHSIPLYLLPKLFAGSLPFFLSNCCYRMASGASIDFNEIVSSGSIPIDCAFDCLICCRFAHVIVFVLLRHCDVISKCGR